MVTPLSALLAMCASRYRARLDAIEMRSRHAVYLAFSAENPLNERWVFLLSLRQQLQRWLGKKIDRSEDLKAVYEHLSAAGKPTKVALTAVMRKMLILANTLLRQDRKWQPRRA